MKKYSIALLITLVSGLGLYAQGADTMRAFNEKVVIIKRSPGKGMTEQRMERVMVSPEDSAARAAYEKAWKAYSDAMKVWSDSVQAIHRRFNPADGKPMPPLPPMPPMPKISMPKGNRTEVIFSLDSLAIEMDSMAADWASSPRDFPFPGMDQMPGHFEEEFMVKEEPAKNPDLLISQGEWGIGFTNIMNEESNMPTLYSKFPELNNGKSLNIFFAQNYGLKFSKGGKTRLWFGVRYDINNYRFKDDNVRLADNQAYFTVNYDSSNNSDKSKVVVNYLSVPIALGYQSNGYSQGDGFYVKAGVNFGYRVRVHTKVKSDKGKTEKEFDDFNFNNFDVSPYVAMGYKGWGFYARYSITPMFVENQGPLGNQISFGMNFLL